jgi:hypothetical protein
VRLVIRMSQVESEDKEAAAPVSALDSPSSPASLSSAVGDFEMLERTAKSAPAASVPGAVPPSDDLAAELASRQWEGGTTDTAAAPVPSAPVAEAAADTAAAPAPAVAIGQTEAAAHQLRKREVEEVLEESERRGGSASDGSIQHPAAPDGDEALPMEDLDPDSPETAVLVPSANIMRFPTMNMDGTAPLPSAPARGELAYVQKPSVAEAASDKAAAPAPAAPVAIGQTEAAAHQLRKKDVEGYSDRDSQSDQVGDNPLSVSETNAIVPNPITPAYVLQQNPYVERKDVLEESEGRGGSASDGSIQRPAAPVAEAAADTAVAPAPAAPVVIGQTEDATQLRKRDVAKNAVKEAKQEMPEREAQDAAKTGKMRDGRSEAPDAIGQTESAAQLHKGGAGAGGGGRGVDKWVFLRGLVSVGFMILVAYFIVVDHSGDDGSLVCVASHSDRLLSWAEMIHAAEIKATSNKEHSNIRLHKLTVVRSEEVKVSDDDLAVLGKKMWSCRWSSCCERVVVIVDADSLVPGRGRNPLTKYTDSTRTSEFLKHSGSTLAIVNATCKTMIEGIDDARTGRLEECQHSRNATFEEFRKIISYSIPKTTPVKDIPPAAELTSGQNHFEMLFTNVEYDSPNDDYSTKLQTRGNQEIDKVCQFGGKEAQTIRDNFPKIQIVLVGKEGAGKSTTAYWLAHHLKTVESLRNTFTSASGGSSFTRNFKRVKLTPTISVADTYGLPDWSFKYLCAIKRLLDGTLVENNRASMTWSEAEDKKCRNSWSDVLFTWIFYPHCIAGFVSLLIVGGYMSVQAKPDDLPFSIACFVTLWSGFVVLLLSVGKIYEMYLHWGTDVNELTCCESQINQKRDLQAHAILFMIRYNDNEKEVIKQFLIKMKGVVKRGSDFNVDMMDRMVFGVSNAPSDEKTFNEWVKKLGLPSKDVFPITWSSIGTDNIFIPPGTLLPILKRLQEKACDFFSDEIEAGRVTKPLSWGFFMVQLVVVVFGVVGVALFTVPRLRRFFVPRLRRFGVANQVLFILGIVMADSLPVPVSPTLFFSHVSTSLPSSESIPCQICQQIRS